MRKILTTSVAALLALGLAGCSGINSVADMYAQLKPVCGDVIADQKDSKVADAIEISTRKGTPKIDFASPLVGTTVQTQVVTKGTGPKVTGNQYVQFDYTIVNGGTGEVVQQSSYDGKDMANWYLTPKMDLPICTGLGGVAEGSRAAIYVPAKIAHNGLGVPDLGISKTDAIIFVIDIHKVFLSKAVGNERTQQAGFPNIVRSTDGVPAMSFLKDATPPSLIKDGQPAIAEEVLIEGAGEKVALKDDVIINYVGHVWNEGIPFDSSWERGEPATFTLDKGSLIQGFLDGLIGQKVGSQVVFVIPPSLGYGDTAQGTIPANSTLVFVVDILGVAN